MQRSYLAIVTLAFIFHMGSAQNNRINWYSVNASFMGYGMSTNITLKSVIGQAVVGLSESQNTRIIAGFLADTSIQRIVVSVNKSELEEIPLMFFLNQNYPNPFNPSTTIRYEVPRRSKVEINVYNMLGQLIATLVNGEIEAGRYFVTWNGRNDQGIQMSSGVYFYQIHADEFTQTKKLILLK